MGLEPFHMSNSPLGVYGRLASDAIAHLIQLKPKHCSSGVTKACNIRGRRAWSSPSLGGIHRSNHLVHDNSKP